MIEPAEVVDGELVLGDGHGVDALRRPGPVAPVAPQAMAVLGASVMAAAAFALVHRRRARRVRRRRRMSAPVLGSRSFLVDVHVLGDRK